MADSILVTAQWDTEAGVWVATTDDVAGFVAEAESFDALQHKVMAVLADLIELDGFDNDLPEIAVRIVAHRTERISNPRAERRPVTPPTSP